MAKIIGEKDLNVAIPEPLWDDLDGIIPGFKPWKKKHVVAAAIGAFVAAQRSQQDNALLAVLANYYRRPSDVSMGTSHGSQGSEVAADGKPHFLGGQKVHDALRSAGEQIRKRKGGRSRHKSTG